MEQRACELEKLEAGMRPYKILMATDNSPKSFHAIDYAFDLCSRMSRPYELTVIYIVALNPETNVPFLANLDRANNLDIVRDAKNDIAKIKEHLKKLEIALPEVKYNFVEREGRGLVGEILKGYVEQQDPDLNLLIVGSRNLEGLKKVRRHFPRISDVVDMILSSTSDYVVKHLQCPVTVVKS